MLPDLIVLVILLALFGAAVYFYRRCCRKTNEPGGSAPGSGVPDTDDNINDRVQ